MTHKSRMLLNKSKSFRFRGIRWLVLITIRQKNEESVKFINVSINNLETSLQKTFQERKSRYWEISDRKKHIRVKSNFKFGHLRFEALILSDNWKNNSLCNTRFPFNFRGGFLFAAVMLKLQIMKRFLALSAGGGPMSRKFVGVQMKAFQMWDATQTYFL